MATRQQIEQLAETAYAAGEFNLAKRCRKALAGSKAAWREVNRRAEEASVGEAPESVTDEPRPTERQVRYALDLQQSRWTPATFGGTRYTREAFARMSRREISSAINLLLQEG